MSSLHDAFSVAVNDACSILCCWVLFLVSQFHASTHERETMAMSRNCIIWSSTLGFVCLFCLYSNIYSHHFSHPLVSGMFFYISGLMVAAKQCLGALLPPSDCSSVLKLVKTKGSIEANKCKNYLFFGENLSKISTIHTVESITFELWLCCYKKKGVSFNF